MHLVSISLQQDSEILRVLSPLPETQKHPVYPRTSLAVQWLRLCVPNAGDTGSIPDWGTKILYGTQGGQKIKK